MVGFNLKSGKGDIMKKYICIDIGGTAIKHSVIKEKAIGKPHIKQPPTLPKSPKLSGITWDMHDMNR